MLIFLARHHSQLGRRAPLKSWQTQKRSVSYPGKVFARHFASVEEAVLFSEGYDTVVVALSRCSTGAVCDESKAFLRIWKISPYLNRYHTVDLVMASCLPLATRQARSLLPDAISARFIASVLKHSVFPIWLWDESLVLRPRASNRHVRAPPLPPNPLDVPGPALRNIVCSTFVTRCGVVQEILAAPGLRNAVMEQLKVVAGEERPWEQVRRDGLASMIYALGELQGDMCSALLRS